MITLRKNASAASARVLRLFISFCFLFNLILPSSGFAQALNLPQPGTMIALTPAFRPARMIGVEIHPENPFQFDFIVNGGDENLQGEGLKAEAEKMIKYFMASLTIPEKDLWVNLSPYEQDRIAPDALAQTDLGRDLLAQDYILKQLTASLIHPETDLGKAFWDKVYQKAYATYQTTQIPVDTFNKVWIMPDKAVVYRHGNMAFVAEASLKVLLEEDYLALQESQNSKFKSQNENQKLGESSELNQPNNTLASQILREIVIPELQKEVNSGKNFAILRQVYHALILGAWFKRNLKESLLGKFYVDQSTVEGIDIEDKGLKQSIYEAYLTAYKQGAYNFIRTEYDKNTQRHVPRKYFSGGIPMAVEGALKETSLLDPNQKTNIAGSGENTKITTIASPLMIRSPEYVVSRLSGEGLEAAKEFLIHNKKLLEGEIQINPKKTRIVGKSYQVTHILEQRGKEWFYYAEFPDTRRSSWGGEIRNHAKKRGASPLSSPIKSDPEKIDLTTFLSSLLSVRDLDLEEYRGKTVVILNDFNVPLTTDNKVRDDSRITAALATIEMLSEAGAKVVLMSHLGRPGGKREDKYSLFPIVERLRELMKDRTIHFDTNYQTAADAKVYLAGNVQEGEILVLENTRFNPGEEALSKAQEKMDKALKDNEGVAEAQDAFEAAQEKHDALVQRYFDGVALFINDAFSVSHRGFASVIGAPESISRVAGLLVYQETEALKKFIEGAEVVVMGGSKVSDKIKIIENLLASKSLKHLLIGGAMRNAFLAALDVDVKESFGANEKEVAVARKLLDLHDPRIVLPVDVVAVPKIPFEKLSDPNYTSEKIIRLKLEHLLGRVFQVPDGWELVDIGPSTVKYYRDLILKSKLTFMNGAMGISEIDQLKDGTEGVLQALVDAKKEGGYTGLGGGDTVTAVNKFGLSFEDFGHVFLAGGATLEVLEGKFLPGLLTLSQKAGSAIVIPTLGGQGFSFADLLNRLKEAVDSDIDYDRTQVVTTRVPHTNYFNEKIDLNKLMMDQKKEVRDRYYEGVGQASIIFRNGFKIDLHRDSFGLSQWRIDSFVDAKGNSFEWIAQEDVDLAENPTSSPIKRATDAFIPQGWNYASRITFVDEGVLPQLAKMDPNKLAGEIMKRLGLSEEIFADPKTPGLAFSLGDNARLIVTPYYQNAYAPEFTVMVAAELEDVKDEKIRKVGNILQDIANTQAATPTGGLDFATLYEELNIRTDDLGVPLAVQFQDVENIRIDSLTPIIIQMTPVDNLPFILGFEMESPAAADIARVSG